MFRPRARVGGHENGRRDQEPDHQQDRPTSLCLAVLRFMTSKDEVSAAKAAAEAARAELNAHWGSFFDEEGQFEATFGDPKKTPFAIRIWIGYDEDGETKVDLVYPAIEHTPFGDGDGMTDDELETLEGICLESADLLDKAVPEFANTIYDFLNGLSPHASFSDPLRAKWLKLKQEAAEKVEARKLSVDTAQVKEQKSHKYNRRYAIMQGWDRRRQQQLAMQEYNRQLSLLQSMRQAQSHLAQAELEKKAAVIRKSWYGGPNPKFRQNEGPFDAYLEMVAAMEQTFLIYAKEGITSVPPVIVMLSHLQEVNLSQNRLTSVPDSIFELPNLKRLFLYQNELRSVSSSIGLCSKLEVLDLHRNQIAVLPSDIGALSMLQSLDVEHNRLKAIPDSVGDLSAKLSYLNFAHNSIKIVPTVLSTLTNLAYFNLKNNPIVNLPPHIYLQGTAASMKYLREVSFDSAEQYAASALRGDFAALIANKGWLTDLILRSRAHEDPTQPSPISIPVHRVIVSARCPAICNLLQSFHSSKIQLKKDTTTELPILPLDISEELLRVLIAYIYEDKYNAPTLELVNISLGMTEEQVVEAVKQNQILTAAHRAAIDRAYNMASNFNVPHLTHLIDMVAKIPTPERQEGPFISEIKSLWCGNKASHQQSTSSFASATASSSSSDSVLTGTYPFDFDISFTFPAYPDAPLVHAHKAILCARSKFLSSMLTGGLLESTQRVVEMKEIDPSVFTQMIEFCYSDDVEELNGETILELLMAARLYGLDRLLGIVESVVGYSLDLNNVTSIMMTAFMYQLQKLARACKFFVLSNWESVTKSEGWQECSQAVRDKLTKTAISWGVLDDPSAQNSGESK